MADALPPPTPVIPSRIETSRLVLRPYAAEDGPALFEAVQETQDELRRWIPWHDKHPTVEASTETCVRLAGFFRDRTDFTMGIFDRESGRFLGGTGLHRVRWELPSFEIGYWLRQTAIGHGYVTESTATLVRLCFEQLGAARVELMCDPRNVRSTAVAERIGFLDEGTLRNALLGVSGKPRDRKVYALVPTDWERMGPRITRLATREV